METVKQESAKHNLNQWVKDNPPGKDYLWYDEWYRQINFVRNYFQHLLGSPEITVPATHRSKSLICPIYAVETHSLSLWMRYNFFNWNVSVRSITEIDICFDILGSYDYCFCEGMEAFKFSDYSLNKQIFTVCIDDHYGMYVFGHILRKAFGSIN